MSLGQTRPILSEGRPALTLIQARTVAWAQSPYSQGWASEIA